MQSVQASDYLPVGRSIAAKESQNTWQRDFWALSGAIALVGLAQGSLLPLSAARLELAGHGTGLIGLLLGLHALGLMLAMPLTAPAVARLGARGCLRGAAALAAGNAMLLQQADSTLALGLGLTCLGVWLGLVFNLVETWVNEILPEAGRGRWLAVHCTIFTLFQLCGPLLLPLLPAGHDYQLCGLLLLAGLPACQSLSGRVLGAEPGEDGGDEGGDAGGAERPGEPQLRWWQVLVQAPAIVWSTALFALFDAVVLGLLPLYARAQGMDEAQALLSASVVLAGDTALEWCVGALADRHGRLPVHLACTVVLLAGAVLLPLAVATPAWWLLLFLVGGAAGGIYVLSLMASGQRYSGRALLQITSLLGAAWGAASCVGPLLTGALMAVNTTWSLPGVLAGTALLLLLALGIEERRQRGERDINKPSPAPNRA